MHGRWRPRGEAARAPWLRTASSSNRRAAVAPVGLVQPYAVGIAGEHDRPDVAARKPDVLEDTIIQHRQHHHGGTARLVLPIGAPQLPQPAAQVPRTRSDFSSSSRTVVHHGSPSRFDVGNHGGRRAARRSSDRAAVEESKERALLPREQPGCALSLQSEAERVANPSRQVRRVYLIALIDAVNE